MSRTSERRPRNPRAVDRRILAAFDHPSLPPALAQHASDRRTTLWIEAPGCEPVMRTPAELAAEVPRLAGALAGAGVRRGDRVLLALPTGIDFVELFWGILWAGGVAAPAYPPATARQLEAYPERLRDQIRTIGARLVVVPPELRDFLADQRLPAELVAPEDIRARLGEPLPALRLGPGDPALIQFSSGSTGNPKGIWLTHGNILANLRGFARRMRIQPDDFVVTWLPLYHDMGLIGTMIAPIAAAVPVAIFSPLDFLRRPAFWLQLLSRHRATIGVAPQFAYSLCARVIDPAALSGIDLSAVRILLNGAEPIDAQAVRAFERRLAPLGLRRKVVTPCYGLGEATLAVAMAHPRTGVKVATPAADRSATKVPSAGPPIDGMEVKIVGKDGRRCREGEVGEICVRGPSVTRGYLEARRLRPATDTRGWLRTGDLGFLQDGELYVTGRCKDVIIIGGRNYYPQDIEREAAQEPPLRPGRAVAFGVRDPRRGTEELVLVAEARQREVPADLVSRLRRRLLRRFGVVPHDLVLLDRGELPVTTSGKVRRSATRERYERDGFPEAVFRLRGATAAPSA